MADLLKPTSVETPSAPVEVSAEGTNVGVTEHAPERAPEKKEQVAEHEVNVPVAVAPTVTKASTKTEPKATATAVQKDAVTVQVEHILEEGLGEMYASLPPDAKAAFRVRGEQISTEIAAMVRTFRVKVSNVLRLIRSWLHTIPGVNKYFLEQEAKLKTDSIIELAKANRESLPPTP